MLSKRPPIAVLIPHYNNCKALQKTLYSLKYSGKMEIVVVDDGSDIVPTKEELHLGDSTNKVVLHIIYLKQNSGIEKALNNGLGFIRSKLQVEYIARIDSGDIQVNNRLNRQVDFMQEHGKIGFLGSAAEFVSTEGTSSFRVKYPQESKKIRYQMGLRCSILHPTVMFRSSILNRTEFYPDKYPFADDYAFFRMLLKKTDAANLPEVLTLIEQNGNSASVRNRKQQLKSRIHIIYDNFASSPLSIVGMVYTFVMMLLPYQAIVQLKRRLS